MTRDYYIPLTRIRLDRFLFLLISILLLFVLRPFMEGFIGMRLFMDAFVTFILISGVYAVSEKKKVFIVALILALPAFVGSWSVHFMENSYAQVVAKVSGGLFFAFTAISLMSYLVKAKRITSDIIPLTSQARSLTLLEAVFGQIYLAVVIARLVGIQITQSMENNGW